MQLLLAILLYLRLIFSPGVYQESYIRFLEKEHQAEIQAVQNDPQQMEIVNRDYMGPAEQVIVIDDMDGD
jgi:hypothetical protein